MLEISHSKHYFEKMEQTIINSPITFKEFAIYCKYLRLAIADRTLEDPLHYAFILYHAPLITNSNKELYDMYREELKEIMATCLSNDLKRQGIDLDRYFDIAEQEAKTHTISLDQFFDYFEKLQLADILHVDVDLLSCALSLREADIKLSEKHTELLKFNKYYSMLADYIRENKKTR